MSKNLSFQAIGFPRSSISILIPVFNNDCTPLVADLVAQAERLVGVEWEVLVAEDGSTDEDCVAVNHTVRKWPHCRHIIRKENIGRSRIRNLLGVEARHEWLLFIDSHMRVGKEDFLTTYLRAEAADVVDGDYVVAADEERWGHSLRYRYEMACMSQHTPVARRQRPYAGFHTANFMIRRDLFLDNPFQESFSEYGYEDVLFGANLEKRGTDILHIDNPVEFRYFESNSRFLEKTEAAMRSLSDHQEILGRHSRLLAFYHRLRCFGLHKVAAALYRLRGQSWRQRLAEGTKVSLHIFNAYRLTYFCHYLDRKR